MTQQEKHLEVADDIQRHLSSDLFDSFGLTEKNKYQPWYATVLSSIVLMSAGEEVVYAYADFEPSMADVRLVVFTTNLVLIADIDRDADGVPVAQAIQRRSLIGMKLSASERIDAHDRRSHDWPGALNLMLTYRDLLDPIEIVTSGVNTYSVNQPAPIVTLIEALSADLAN